MRWWGPIHEHYAMTDMQSLALSVAATVIVVSIIGLSVRATKKRRLHITPMKHL